MSAGVFGPPPPGLDLSSNRVIVNNAAVITTYTIATVAIGLRFFTRTHVQMVKIAADDLFILGALLAVSSSLAATIIAGYHGLGMHVWAVPINDVVEVMHILFAYVLIYILTVPFIKFSILLFYRRIFGPTWTIWLCSFLTVGYCVGCLVAFLSCCRPLSYYWTQYLDLSGGKCMFDLFPFYIGNAAANLTTDILILLIPIPIIWGLQMPKSQKIMIIGIFLLGGFACVASIVRIYYITFLATSPDVTWIMGYVYIWSSVEPCIGILCACLPTFKPLLRYTFTKVSSYRSDRYNYPGRSGSRRNTLRGEAKTPLDCDETQLTIHAVQIQMADMSGQRIEDDVITVEKDFRIDSEGHLLNCS